MNCPPAAPGSWTSTIRALTLKSSVTFCARTYAWLAASPSSRNLTRTWVPMLRITMLSGRPENWTACWKGAPAPSVNSNPSNWSLLSYSRRAVGRSASCLGLTDRGAEGIGLLEAHELDGQVARGPGAHVRVHVELHVGVTGRLEQVAVVAQRVEVEVRVLVRRLVYAHLLVAGDGVGGGLAVDVA